jgi:hypothetical protein
MLLVGPESERKRKRPLTVYVSRDLVKALDESRGPFSRSRFVALILQNAVTHGVDVAKLIAGGSTHV